MISVEEARQLVMSQVRPCGGEHHLLDNAVGRVVIVDIVSPEAYPLSDVSAVDGYAVGTSQGPWTVVGELAAGDTTDIVLGGGDAYRIFTGATVPIGTTAVLMQERCTREGPFLIHEGAPFLVGANIRREGESVKAGEVILRKGSVLTPAAIGLLASCGLKDVMVSTEPVVSIIRTGGEFIEDGASKKGRIHSSNDRMLIGALREAGCYTKDEALLAQDEADELRRVLLAAVQAGGVVITTGGASVGDHDLLVPVLKEMNATIHFHGVAQKPGKPMFFATLNGVPIFGLPGNPRAALVLFYEYVLPFLSAMRQRRDPWLRTHHLPLNTALTLKGDRAEFRAARVQDGRVELLADEGSHMLRTLVEADALVYLPAAQRAWNAGDPVEVHALPHHRSPQGR